MARSHTVHDLDLKATFDTYKSLDEQKCDRLAEQYLLSSLRIILGSYLNHHNGRLEPLLSSKRTQYLTGMPYTHFWHLREDLLEELFRRGSVFDPLALATTADSDPERSVAKRWLAVLEEEDFNALLVDFVYELERRSYWTHRGGVGEISHLSTTSERKMQVSASTSAEDTYSIRMILPNRLHNNFSEPAFDTSLAKRLIRRALSASFRPAKRDTNNGGTTLRRMGLGREPMTTNHQPVGMLKTVHEDSEVDQRSPGCTPTTPKAQDFSIIHSDTKFAGLMNLGSDYGDDLSQTNTLALEPHNLNGARDSCDLSMMIKRQSPNLPFISSADWTYVSTPTWNNSTSTLSNSSTFLTARSSVARGSPASLEVGYGNNTNRISTASSYLSALCGTEESNQQITSEYHRLLEERNLIVDPLMETNWSERGQHAEYAACERGAIPLTVEKLLGRTQRAVVESVRCRRIRLARKTIKCNKRPGMTRKDAIREVEHLQRVKHAHVVRVVGTYVIENELAILTYPVAEWNLEDFMQSIFEDCVDSMLKAPYLERFITCLASTLNYLHSFPIKHMDIKPTNFLVRNVQNSTVNEHDLYKIYITDFGISRAYESLEDSETGSWTSYTRAYAAREVILQESRGLSADVFSLGCVYTEILAVIADTKAPDLTSRTYWDSLHACRECPEIGFRAYQAAVPDICEWLAALPLEQPELDSARNWSVKMLDHDPSKRPSANEVANDPSLPFGCPGCKSGPEAFEVAPPLNNKTNISVTTRSAKDQASSVSAPSMPKTLEDLMANDILLPG